ncbi:uncharacterized protein LOC144006830 isoform X2 [Festucalex cinctus]
MWGPLRSRRVTSDKEGRGGAGASRVWVVGRVHPELVASQLQLPMPSGRRHDPDLLRASIHPLVHFHSGPVWEKVASLTSHKPLPVSCRSPTLSQLLLRSHPRAL